MTGDVEPARSLRRSDSWKRAIVHLRLPFSIILAPLYLWGVFLALTATRYGATVHDGVAVSPPWLRILSGFLIIHGPLYGGMNAYNSYYDRDDGPIGALAEPPPVDGAVLALSVAAKAIALATSLAFGRSFFLFTLASIVLSVAYSHPRWRWKERPPLAALTIFFGQGVLGVLWGWSATTTGSGWPGDGVSWLGVLGAALWTLGYYPLTGAYQVAGDARRGVRTLAVALSVEGCFRFAGMVALPAGALMGAVLIVRHVPLAALAAGVYLGVVALQTVRWRRRFEDRTARENQRTLMRLGYANGVFFSVFFGVLIARL